MIDKPIIPNSLKGNIALLRLTTYDTWLLSVGKKTRYMIRKSQRKGLVVSVGVPKAFDVFCIYNETPIRQGRKFSHYGVSLYQVEKQINLSKGVFVRADFDGKTVGFCELLHNGNTVVISQILSLTSFWSLAVNNALIAKTVEYSASVSAKFIVYARFGNHPSLDRFKRSCGFVPYWVGGFVHVWDLLPSVIRDRLVWVYNWFSCLEIKLKRSKFYGLFMRVNYV